MTKLKTILPALKIEKTIDDILLMDDILLDIAYLVHKDESLKEDLAKYSSSQRWVMANNDEFSQFIGVYEKGKIVGYSLLRRNPKNNNQFDLVHSYAINHDPRIYNALELKARNYLERNGFIYNPFMKKNRIKKIS